MVCIGARGRGRKEKQHTGCASGDPLGIGADVMTLWAEEWSFPRYDHGTHWELATTLACFAMQSVAPTLRPHKVGPSVAPTRPVQGQGQVQGQWSIYSTTMVSGAMPFSIVDVVIVVEYTGYCTYTYTCVCRHR